MKLNQIVLCVVSIGAGGLVAACSEDLITGNEETGLVETRLVWNRSNISVCWVNEDPASIEAIAVRERIRDTWEAASNVTFTGWGRCGRGSADITIEVSSVVSPRSQIGTNSMQASPSMRLDFAYESFAANTCNPTSRGVTEEMRLNCIRNNAVHEFGHALGFHHEQNRPNLTAQCRGLLSSESISRSGSGGFWVGEFDDESVMNYCNRARWRDGGALSDSDVEMVQIFYGAPSRFNDRKMHMPRFYTQVNRDLGHFNNNGGQSASHWAENGLREGRVSSPMFSVRHYLLMNPDLMQAFGHNYVKAAEHWLNTGMASGRESSPVFNPKYYVENNPDVRDAFGNDYAKAVDHYRAFGVHSGRKAHENFDPKAYLHFNPDVRRSVGSDNYLGAIVHYMRDGIAEGRRTTY